MSLIAMKAFCFCCYFFVGKKNEDVDDEMKSSRPILTLLETLLIVGNKRSSVLRLCWFSGFDYFVFHLQLLKM